VKSSAGGLRAHFGLGVLTSINLVNYLDRYLVAALLPLILKDFGLSYKEGGALATLFIVVYMVAAPLGGYLGDRMPRKVLIAGSVFIWSLATIGSGLAPSFGWLLVARAAVGIGEAGYGTITPGLISDFYPRERRTRMLSIFYTAMPVGAALGFAIGGWVGAAHGWHVAFFVGGVPGLVLSVLSLFIHEPVRGATETGPVEEKVPFAVGLRALGKNGIFWASTLGLTLMTFSVGGLAYWMPTFLEVERHFAPQMATAAFGGVTLLAGLFGTLAGGWLGERAERKSNTGGLWVSGVGLALSAPLVFLTARAMHAPVIFTVVFAAQFLIFMNTGPLNAAICNCVPPHFRSFAMGVSTVILHLLGDAPSPYLIGVIGDRFSLGTAIEVNALPLLLSGAVLLIGARLFRQYLRPAVAAQA